MEKRIESLERLQREAEEFTRRLSTRIDGATLITLSGELGAGKTAFTKAVAQVLGVDETVNSPTFVLEKIYALSNSRFKRLVHIDAYRLGTGSDLAALGFEEIMKDASNLVFLEWPEKVADALPSPTVTIKLQALNDGAHAISYA
jgi:tRNA threonylcarbamoyladenosine biosynthesis protein TsaE